MAREQDLISFNNRREEVRRKIDDMIRKTKGNYITQGVSFNKTCPRQMKLLEEALMESASFSGLVKELFAIRYDKNFVKKSEYIEEDDIRIDKKKELENNWL